MRSTLSIAAGVASLALWVAPASAQYECSISTTNEWLTSGNHPSPETQLSDDRVHPVTQRLPQAIAKLERRSAVRLSEADTRDFLGASTRTTPRRSRAYLVRAVYPTPYPRFWVKWDGTQLDVFAGGLGCAHFTKHPIIVFLERQPREVYVGASAAL